MKKKILAIGAVITALFGITTSLFAQGATRSFNVTNYLSGNTVVSGWPTNTLATNGVGQGTGNPLYIGQFDTIGLYCQGQLVTTNTTNASIAITLLTSTANGSPQVVIGTNAFQTNTNGIAYNDWPLVTNSSLSAITFNIPTSAANGTNWIHFETNLANTLITSSANWVGVWAIAPTLNTGGILTNFTIGINTKLLPRPLIGQ